MPTTSRAGMSGAGPRRDRLKRWYYRNRDELRQIRRLVVYPAVTACMMAALILGGYHPAGSAVAAAEPPIPDAAQPGPRWSQEVFEQASPAVVKIVKRDEDGRTVAIGSGFFVDPDGTLVTCHHVIARAETATVHLRSGEVLEVTALVGQSRHWDLAVLKVEGKGLPYLDLAPSDEGPAVGEAICAINSTRYPTQFADGVVTALRTRGGWLRVRSDTGQRSLGRPSPAAYMGGRFIETTAAAFPGWSGSPIVDKNGRVVGVTMSISFDGPRRLTHAVPATYVRHTLAKAARPTPDR